VHGAVIINTTIIMLSAPFRVAITSNDEAAEVEQVRQCMKAGQRPPVMQAMRQ